MGRLSQRFHSDFDRKVMGGNSLHYILSNGFNIIASPAVRPSLNGSTEWTWITLIQMAILYITEKRFGREFLYLAVCHAAMTLNQVPGISVLKLTTPFEIFHNSKPVSKIWFELFSIRYFNNDTDNTKSWSKLQAYNLDVIPVGRYNRSNSIIFYNPITSRYYHPSDFQLDESRITIANFPNPLRFDGGLTWGFLRKKTDPIHEPFLLGTRVYIQNDNALACGTIKNIKISVSPILKCAESPSP